jgi:hypothetical protein
MLNDESGKAKGYLSLHYGCDPVNGKLGLELSFDILRHWFSLIEGRKSYWAKVREIKKPI